MKVITCENKEFDGLWDELCQQNLVHPILSLNHKDFYKELLGNNFIKDLSFIVLDQDTPILGVGLSSRRCDKGNLKFDYLGLAAPVVLSSESNSKQRKSAGLEVKRVLRDIGLFDGQDIAEKGFKFEILNEIALQSGLADEIFPLASKISPNLNRVIDLGLELNELHSDLSKSVKQAVKQSEKIPMLTSIIDLHSADSEVEDAFDALKTLHFASAGRLTRSEKSWEIQKEGILNGSNFISQSRILGNVVSSALFLNGNNSSFYGVSASSKEFTKISLSHCVVWEAIKYSKEVGMQKVFLGSQYSEKTQTVSQKEISIERFKSLFGGSLLLSVLAERNV